jgi:hypothetical protein
MGKVKLPEFRILRIDSGTGSVNWSLLTSSSFRGRTMTTLPEGYQPVQSTIGGVTYKGGYCVDNDKHVVRVSTEFGSGSTPALKRRQDQRARDKANESAALGLFRAMVYKHLQTVRAP